MGQLGQEASMLTIVQCCPLEKLSLRITRLNTRFIRARSKPQIVGDTNKAAGVEGPDPISGFD